MKIAVWTLLALLLSFAVAGLGAGDSAIDRGEYSLAVDEYRETLDANPEHVRALYSIARAETLLAATLEGAEAERIYTMAAEHARAAIAIDPDEPEAHFELARALGRLAQFRGILQSLNLAGEVRSEFERTLELDPEHADALHALAMWHLNVPWIAGGRRAEVETLFEQSIALEPDVITHHVDYGEALLELGQPERARSELEAAMNLEAETAIDHEDQEKAQGLLEEHF